MADENWQRVREIFNSALLRKPEERERYLIEACHNDESLFHEVKSLLSSLDSADSFLETPVVARVADAIADNLNKLETGECLGHYKIIRPLGAGGMGMVYLAHDQKLERNVAIKILNENFSHGPNLDRFLQEAKLASALNHPNILIVHEVGEVEGTHFIVSEFIAGKTLRETLKESSLTLLEILDLSIQISKAIAVAHEASLVHRDIKPENIMVRPDGIVKVLDFGLAKLVEQENKSLLGLDGAMVKRNQTAQGVILGTINYISPEQARYKAVDERTDIWSLGVCLYEMLTGKPPFSGETTSDTISEILSKNPAPFATHVQDIPEELERIVSRALRKDRDERYQHITDLLFDLRNFKQEFEANRHSAHDSSVKADKRAAAQSPTITDADKARPIINAEYVSAHIKSHKVEFVIVLIGLLVVVALTLTYSFRNHNQTALSFQAGQTTRLTSNGKTKLTAISPDAKFVAYVIDDEGRQNLWLKNVAAGSEEQIPLPAEHTTFNSLTFSPDSNYIFYGTQAMLFQLPVLGGMPKKILSNYGGSISFSPDGRQFAYITYPSGDSETAVIVISNTDGTGERILAASKRPNIFLHSAAWSPDGKLIACVALTADGYQEVVTVGANDGVVSLLRSAQWSTLARIIWKADGKGLFILAENNENVLTQLWSLSYPGGEPRKLITDSHNYHGIGLSADGTSLVALRTEQETNLWVMPSDDTSQARQITSGFGKYDGFWGINWTTRNKIIYENAPDGDLSVWRIDPDGRNAKELSPEGGSTTASPDGDFLVYQFASAEGTGLFRLRVNDGEKKRLTTGVDIHAVISPDGKWVVFTRYADDVALWRVPLEGGPAVKLTNLPGFALTPAISPDGRFIAFVHGRSGTMSFPSLAIVPFDGGHIVKEFDVPTALRGQGRQTIQWTPDGQAINYASLHDHISNIWRQPIDGSPPVPVTRFDSGLIFNFAFSPDGKQLVLSRGNISSDVVLIRGLN